ncbi:N-acetyl-gamma-glutamyl-phosphate reductase [Desulfobacterium sp. N47]|uniref:N-acetyl-gamma-glutamyl-phosphate reductase n=1 Tax=uncultured Desulfobacterium sp. TaxID=201089 RepID=E1Y815_9BACT|nr:N-acetyl-gamma-glutamyl-phosphate reductase [uncultured Desulfobacterium sp.]
MVRVGVVGATGYAGAELVRILSGHPKVKITVITSRQYAGLRFDKVFPSMAGHTDLVCEELSVEKLYKRAELFFLSLPHKIPMEIAPVLINKGKKVIDLSADFRFKNHIVYSSFYQEHTAKDLLEKAVYGLSEVYYDKIKTADLIGNPGCYPTSTLLPLIPLLKAGLVDAKTIITDSKSGVSGAGRSLALSSHFCEVNESFRAYKVASHRHNPEINEILSCEAGKDIKITFVPHLVPMTRGMLTTSYAQLKKNISAQDINECMKSFYSGRPFVRLLYDQNRLPDTLHVRGTNYCDIGFVIDKETKRIILISAIDNLVKGASGQAVQNMNIMLGFDETTGLKNVPYPL